MFHAFSIDVEDWYQGLEIPIQKWPAYEQRVHHSMSILLELLQKHNLRVTCFILGKLAEEHPSLVKQIHRAGHEIATHGYSHKKVYSLTPKSFRNELRHSIALLEDLTGEKVIGHRAAYFTITQDSLWALDILAEEGILYDSSIYPVVNYRYGIANANRLPSYIPLNNGGKILEIPVSTVPLPKFNFPMGGGAYFRIYPYWFFQKSLQYLESKQEIFNMYLHPWELDPSHPVIRLPFRVAATHYFNLKSTHRKLQALFSQFKFAPYKEVYKGWIEDCKNEKNVLELNPSIEIDMGRN